MIFKYKNKEIEVPDTFLIKCGIEAEKRGMTLEEYIAEAFAMLKEKQTNWSYDANGSPV
jgi:hypothetical protein